MADLSGKSRTHTEREAMASGMGGGWPGYLQRLRAGHVPTFTEGRGVEVVYSGCSCGQGLCPIPHLLAHIDDCLAAYDAKVQDFAAETLRSSSARAALRRAVSPVQLAARLGAVPLYSGDFFDRGFPPDEREALRMALGDEEFDTLREIVLEPGHGGVVHSGRPSDDYPDAEGLAVLREQTDGYGRSEAPS